MLIQIDEIKVKDRIRKDFGNIEELANDIKENGLINPPVVSADTFELIAGERRLRALKMLGYQQVEVRPMAVSDAEHQLNLEISENETRKDFNKAERIDYARRLERIESIKARERQATLNNAPSNVSLPKNSSEAETRGETNEIIASKLGIGSKDTYRKEKFIADNKESLTPEDFENWGEGKLSTNKAYLKIKSQLQEKENIINGYKKKLEIAQTDNDNKYKSQIESLKIQLETKNTELDSVKFKKSQLEREVMLNDEKAKKYEKLENDIAYLTEQKNSLTRKLAAATSLAEYVTDVQNFLETKLAPVKFKRCMDDLDVNETAYKGMNTVVYKIESWLKEIKSYMPDGNIIEVEFN